MKIKFFYLYNSEFRVLALRYSTSGIFRYWLSFCFSSEKVWISKQMVIDSQLIEFQKKVLFPLCWNDSNIKITNTIHKYLLSVVIQIQYHVFDNTFQDISLYMWNRQAERHMNVVTLQCKSIIVFINIGYIKANEIWAC